MFNQISGEAGGRIFMKCVWLVADMYSGYLCFVVSIVFIGLLTAVIGDLASHFGCTVGLKDSVTAVTFVALGTSVPGINERI